MERTSAARNRRNATARRSAATSASVPWAAPRPSRISSSEPRRVLPIAAAPTRNASASSPRAQNCFSAWFSGVARGSVPAGARRSASSRIEALTRARRVRVRPRSPRSRVRRGNRAVIDDHGHAWCRSAGWAPSSGPSRTGHTTAGRPCGSTDGAPICNRSDGSGCSSSRSIGQPLVGDRADLRMHRGVDLGAPRHGRGVGGPQIHRLAGRWRPRSAAGRPGRVGRSRTGSPRCPWIAGHWRGRSPGRTRNGRPAGRSPAVGITTLATTPPLRQAIRSASTLAGTPPIARERFGDQRQRRGRLLVGGEGDEPPPGERQHRAEQEQPRCGLGPVDHQILTR